MFTESFNVRETVALLDHDNVNLFSPSTVFPVWVDNDNVLSLTPQDAFAVLIPLNPLF